MRNGWSHTIINHRAYVEATLLSILLAGFLNLTSLGVVDAASPSTLAESQKATSQPVPKRSKSLFPSSRPVLKRPSAKLRQTPLGSLSLSPTSKSTSRPALRKAAKRHLPARKKRTQTRKKIASKQGLLPPLRRIKPSSKRAVRPLRRVKPSSKRAVRPLRRVHPPLKQVVPPLRRVNPELKRVVPPLRRVNPELKRVLPYFRVRPVLRRVRPLVRPVLRRVRPLVRPVLRRVRPLVRPVLRRVRPLVRPVLRRVRPLVRPFHSLAKVKRLLLGKPVWHRLEVGDVAWFRFHVGRPGWYVFDSLGRSDPYCRLYRSDFHRAAQNDDSGRKRNCRILHRLRRGTYYIEVMLFPYRSKRFAVTVHRLPSAFVSQGEALSGKIEKPGSMKLYRVLVMKDGLYEFASTGTTDVTCALLDSSQSSLTYLATDDDSGKGTNCSLMQYLSTGSYTFLVRSARFSKTGAYRVHFRKAKEARLRFHAITFGEPMRARLKSSRHRNRYHFRLGERTRVSFLTKFNNNTPQLRLRDLNGHGLPGKSYSVRFRGRVRLLSRLLNAGEYYLELRSPGKPKSAYTLWAYKDRDVVIPPNRARLIADGTPQGTVGQPFWYSLFKVTLDGGAYHIIEAKHKALVACFLEDSKGNWLVSRRVSRAERGVCRIEGRGRHGDVWVRLLMRKPTRGSVRLRRRRSNSVMQTSQPSPLERLSDEVKLHRQPKEIELYRQPKEIKLYRQPKEIKLHRQPKEIELYRQPGSIFPNIVPLPKKRVRKVVLASQSSAGLPLTNSRIAPQIRFYQFVPKLLAQNQVQRLRSQRKSGGFLVEVSRPGLYWFSLEGKGSLHCKLSDMLERFIKQSIIFPQGCNIAAYLLRGSYILRFRYQKNIPLLRAVWRSYRSFPAILGSRKILIGPVRKGHKRRLQMRVRHDGFYKIRSHLISSVPLVTRLSLLRGSRQIARHGRKTYRMLVYLRAGLYHVQVKVSQGRGAYSLRKVRLETRKLRYRRTLSGRLAGSGSKDYYVIEPRGPRIYQIQTVGKTDTFCRLYDTKGKRIAFNDDSGPGQNCRITKALRAQKYLLEVSSLLSPGGSYQISFKTVLRKPSRVLRLGRARRGRLRSRRNVHRYRFRIRRSGKYIIATRNPRGTRTDPKCYLYERGRLRRYNDDSGPKFNCRIVQYLRRGWYSLVIKLAWSTRKGPYLVAVRRWGQAFPGSSASVRQTRKRTRTRRRRSGLLSQKGGVVLRPGLRVQAMLVRTRRVDAFALHISHTGRYRIQTDGHIDTKCFLDDRSGGVLGVDDDSGPGANCRLLLRLPAGHYQIRILARPAGRMGPYGIRVKSR